MIGLELRKKLSDINKNGGCVKCINKKIEFCNNINIYTSLGANKEHKHNTGIVMSIVYNINEKKVKILNSGDQEYRYISDGLNNTKIFEDIDILVASHHGGKYDKEDKRKGYDCSTYNNCNPGRFEYTNTPYCWTYSSLMDKIPKPKNSKSVIIYSAGNNRRYNHPSRKMDYREIGWIREHITKIDGTFELRNWIYSDQHLTKED